MPTEEEISAARAELAKDGIIVVGPVVAGLFREAWARLDEAAEAERDEND